MHRGLLGSRRRPRGQVSSSRHCIEVRTRPRIAGKIDRVNVRSALFLVALPLCAQLPDAARAKLAEASNLAGAGQSPKAEEILTTLSRSYPRSAEVRHTLGLVLLRAKKHEAARRELEAAATLDAKSPLIRLALAQARLETGSKVDAMRAAAEALRLAPGEPVVARALAMFYGQAGEFSKAAEQETRWARANPKDRLALLRAAEYHLRANEAEAAIRLAEEVAAASPSAPAQSILGKAYRLQRDPPKAVAALQEAIRLDPAQPAYVADLAQLFLDHNTPEPARMLLEQAVPRFPEDVELWRMLGLACYAVGNTERALDEFLRVTEMEPDSALSYAALESLLPDAGNRLDLVVGKFRAFAERHPKNPVAHYLLAMGVATRDGASAETEALLRRAIATEPGFWPAWFELHTVLKAQDRFDEAAKALEQTLKLNPDHAAAHYSLAQIYARLEDTARAAEHRQKHHQLVLRDREETDRKRREMPRLAYEVRKG